MGDELVVGVNSDEECRINKGPTIFTEWERADLIRNCKWVTEVAENTPYVATVELLDSLNCDFYAHGDDVSVAASG